MLKNTDAITLQALLDFMYSGATEMVSDTASSLVAAADQFNMIDLKDICCEYLETQEMKLEDIGRLLILADQHTLPRLKFVIMAFLRKANNAAKFAESEGFDEIFA
ncbi:hypothetical protein BV898_05049 [Hypsibius exemplaris]|uniref:BTB domain-containing protein n=1 Tax=Hypsibius exemplaris TaxID=2072580 RepID=A0A1W0X0K0_HYPEX|nr:hypothetical protein BV898_05049 [Hypsibius exemplaris]